MSRVVITLERQDYERLMQLALRERRKIPEQGAVILERQLRRMAKRGEFTTAELQEAAG